MSKIGRGYALAFAILFFATALGAIVLFRTDQWAFVLGWWGDLALYIGAGAIGFKEIGKIGVGLTSKNNHSQPAKKG